ncbi:MAG TPA: ATP-grasp domain-containing protein [Terriglobia bacterium]|nr:ATP-grasp domain-containing protein [Terriglobia bacterium]
MDDSQPTPRAPDPDGGGSRQRRVLILCTTTGYQTRAFVAAAQKLGLAVAFGSDRCRSLEDPWQDGALALRFHDPDAAASQIVDAARANPVDAIIALGDAPVRTAARACRALGLLSHPPEAADICRDKYLSRACLREAGLNVPAFVRFPLAADPGAILEQGLAVGFPCVLKPTALSASRGVIRADNPAEFLAAFERIRALLLSPEVQVMRDAANHFIQAEAYVEGREVAVEGLVDRGRLQVLAIFDKPDPLEGPFFEETIYVTPSRLELEAQAAIIKALSRAVTALGLYHGPLHAELRLNARGAWMMEVAARSIGGLCSRALRFDSPRLGPDLGPRVERVASLEEVLIHLALGADVRDVRRERAAAGVMMIPIPGPGIYEDVEGMEEAVGRPGVEDIIMTARPAQRLVTLPEGSSYLGFIFARGESPQLVEESLRGAHQKLHFVMATALPVV